MRRVFVLITALFLIGCGKADPDKAQLRREIDRLRQARAEAEQEKSALQKELAAYRADLEHERFRNRELKHKLKEINGLQRIVDMAKRLPKTEPIKEKPAPKAETVAQMPPAPISAAIAVARAVPVAEPPKPKPVVEAKKPTPKAVKTKKVAKKKTTPAPGRPEAPKPAPEARPKPITEPVVAKKPAPAPVMASMQRPQAAARPKKKPAAASRAAPSPVEELQLLGLVNRREGKTLLLSGRVRNNTSLPAQKVAVTCRLYDERNRVISAIRIPIRNGSPLEAGATAAFQTEAPWDTRISGCRFEVEGVQRVDVSRSN